MASTTTDITAVFDDQYRNNLADRAAQWMDSGALVLPVISAALDPHQFPKKVKDKKTDDWVVAYEEDGTTPKPQFPGKAPSYWDFNGNPRLIKRADINPESICKQWSRERVLKILREHHPRGYAAEIGSPMGFCILPTPDLVVVDLDEKDKRETLIKAAQAEGHYIESTPSGGLHIVVAPQDKMRSWTNGPGKFFTNWGLGDDTAHLGEVLCLGKVCLMAPTMRGDGAQYSKLTGVSGDVPVECSDITATLGIRPIAKKARPKKSSFLSELARQSTANTQPSETPRLEDLIGLRAQQLFRGDANAYGNGEDRSETMTAFIQEVYGTENFFRHHNKPVIGTADDLITIAVKVVDCEDKIDRILDTIDQDQCDINDEDKRLERYNYAAGERKREKVRQSVVETQPSEDRPPFVMRGFTADSIVFSVEETGLETEIRTNALTKNNLLTLASNEWWIDAYGIYDEDGKLKGIDWGGAADDLLRARAKGSVYDPSNLRGIGVWSDEGRTVVHCGSHLLVDGAEESFTSFRSRFLYVRRPALMGPSEEEPTKDELEMLTNLVQRWHWEDKASPYFLLGWIGLSGLSGSIPWRPNAWVTGPTEAGKSSLLDEFVLPLVIALGGRKFDGNTTAPGLRQSLGHDATPVVVDEFESDSPTDRKRVDQIVAMVRSSSSNDGAQIAKGTTSGSAITYLLRSSFLFASINVGLEKAQDLNRTLVLALKPLTAQQRDNEADTFELLQKITPTLGRKLLARFVRLLPTILSNANKIELAIRRSNLEKSKRVAKIQAMLLASAGVYAPSEDLELNDARADQIVQAMLAPTGDQIEEEQEETSDAANCLRHLLNHRIQVHREIRMGADLTRREPVRITVQEALNHFVKPADIDIEELSQELIRNGLKIGDLKGQTGLFLYVANNHDGIGAIYKDTQWRSHKDTLRRPGADGVAHPITVSFGGKKMKSRCTRFNLSDLCDGLEPPTEKVEPKKPDYKLPDLVWAEDDAA